ncbi:MAG: hypothetical protein NTV46_04140, partial [Verrucomicrobia bacterium]|nr:hypothetical protein [Verrucomicrobiota bacterium]
PRPLHAAGKGFPYPCLTDGGGAYLQNSAFDLKRANVWSKLDSLKRERAERWLWVRLRMVK